jgi:hypothetical protein
MEAAYQRRFSWLPLFSLGSRAADGFFVCN